jgi:hypothetical protein
MLHQSISRVDMGPAASMGRAIPGLRPSSGLGAPQLTLRRMLQETMLIGGWEYVSHVKVLRTVLGAWPRQSAVNPGIHHQTLKPGMLCAVTGCGDSGLGAEDVRP